MNRLIELLSEQTKVDPDQIVSKKKVEMVLVFAAKRRTVKYLEELLQNYRDTLESEEEKRNFDCKGVTGYSAKSFSNYSQN